MLTELSAALADRYTIVRQLGEGGMATVYLAHDLKHDRPVALKVLKPELAAALGAERFEREIKLAARLQHPHILTVLDSGEIEMGRGSWDVGPAAPHPPTTHDSRLTTLLYFTMPFVEGESLRDRLDREKQLSVDDALRVTREAAQALHYAHEHGVVHRDIKPENLLLTKDGSTLVADFGIARSLGQSEGPALTQTGTSIGTAAYMSPEQAAGERELDARSDIYSLGIVLYEMLAGETPFAAATAQATIARRFTETPKSVRTLRDSVPERIDQALQKALARTAADRFATARQFADALKSPMAVASIDASTTSRPVRAAAPTRRRLAPSWAMLGLGVLIGLGVLFAWRRHAPVADEGSGMRRIAVLPFQNLGDSADAYFADGMTDAVRGKLADLADLEVIASGSSNDYRATSKSPQQIARELGVDYLLEGKVRWARLSDGTSRVQVSPELIRGSTAAVAWQHPFDAGLTDVFQVQADIAGQVAGALKLALGDSARTGLAERPTENLAAYDAYLRGHDLFLHADAPTAVRRAIVYLEQAVALDSSFALPWADLAKARSQLYASGAPTVSLEAAAGSAARRAVALAPTAGWSHSAIAYYLLNVVGDQSRAAQEYETANRLAPGDARTLGGLAHLAQARGQWDSALAYSRQRVELDPRSASAAANIGAVLLWLRHYPEARAALDRSLALAPTSLSTRETRMMVELANGNLAGARAILAQTPAEVDPATLLAYLATYEDLYWVLDDNQQNLLLRLPPSAFDNNRLAWGLVQTQTRWVRSDTSGARAYADTARIAAEAQLRGTPRDPQLHILHGLALAYLGQYSAAITEGQRWVALGQSETALSQYFEQQLARIYVLAGQPAPAIGQLEQLLNEPYYLSRGWLRIDPSFAPLKGNARFEKLIANDQS